MHPDRLQQIQDVFLEALDLPPDQRAAWLDQACKDDAELRRHVTSLLQAHQDAGRIQELAQALHLAYAEDPPPSSGLEGQVLAHYHIQEKLGGGSMGVVYKAHDTRLDRLVALKFLPPHLRFDAEAKQRFIHEAKAASALDHANICTVYEIGETGSAPGWPDGRLFIAMAYYDGETLKQKIARGPLSVDDALDYARQMARGLAKAHRRGIVHRDVKPANMMVTEEGAVKVLDFGIAKVMGLQLTKTGSTVGTVAYMSPEQVRGQQVDGRTDVWSLGVVLYEMLAGERPFRGDHEQAVIYSILKEEPEPLRRVRPEVPEALEHAVLTMLRKDPKARYQQVEGWLGDLGIAEGAGSGSMRRARRWRRPTRLIQGLALAVGLMLLGVVGYSIYQGTRGSLSIKIGHTRPLTLASDLESLPVLSPDGKMIAYVAGQQSAMHLYVRQVAGGYPLALAEDISGYHRWPQWSPDGTRLAFQAEGAIYIVPALGGVVKKLIDPGSALEATSPAWSPDGQHLAYVQGNTIYTREVDNGASRTITDAHEPHSLAWSPDGSRIAFASGNPQFIAVTFAFLHTNLAPTSLWTVSVTGGVPVRVIENGWLNISPVWTSDGGRLLFVSNQGGSRDLYQIRLDASGRPTGAPVRLTTGLNAHTISLSGDGKALAYSVLTRQANIWSVRIPEGDPISVSEAQPVTTGNQVIETMRISPDGQSMVFDSNRSGNQDIYTMPLGGGAPVQLTTHTAPDYMPSWSWDGEQIAFHTFRNGNRDIYVMTPAGERLEQVTKDPAQERAPDWSPDGQHLVFFSDKTRRQELFIASRDPETSAWGPARQLTVDGGLHANWSPDGRLIAYIPGSLRHSMSSPVYGIAVIPPTGDTPRLLVHSQDPTQAPVPEFLAWSPDSRTIYYRAYDADNQTSFWSVPVTGGAPKLLVRFDDPSRYSNWHAFATDGARFFFIVDEQESDIWLMDLITDE